MRAVSKRHTVLLASLGILSFSFGAVAFAGESGDVKPTVSEKPVAPPAEQPPAEQPKESVSVPPTTNPTLKPVTKVEKAPEQSDFVKGFLGGSNTPSAATGQKGKTQAKTQAKPPARPAAATTNDPYAAYRRGYGTNNSTRSYNSYNYGGNNSRSNGFANNSGFQTGNNSRPGNGRISIPPQNMEYYNRSMLGGQNGKLGADLSKAMRSYNQGMTK